MTKKKNSLKNCPANSIPAKEAKHLKSKSNLIMGSEIRGAWGACAQLFPAPAPLSPLLARPDKTPWDGQLPKTWENSIIFWDYWISTRVNFYFCCRMESSPESLRTKCGLEENPLTKAANTARHRQHCVASFREPDAQATSERVK